VTYHYHQIGPSAAYPVLVGFINKVECEFFQNFIKVSGIGPRAAVKALSRPIGEITRAIDAGDVKFLQTLPGIGLQRAKEIVAKLQGKLGRFGLIKDTAVPAAVSAVIADFQDEALTVLLQLQYTKQEASVMIEKAMQRSGSITTTESLLNEIYKQKVQI
jgi:Holliday junction DNA helicase RuvA